MSVFQGKLTATEQQKTWPADKRSRGGGFECILLGTRVQVYSKVCLWLRGQEIHLGGNWNVGRLKGHDRYVSLGGGNQMTFTCSLMSLWGCAELPGRAHEKHKCARGAWHTLNGRFQRTDPAWPSTPTQTRWPVFPWMLQEESGSDGGWGGEVGGGGWWGRGFYWI